MKTKAARRFGNVLRLLLVLVILAGMGVGTSTSILADEATPGAETTTAEPTVTPTAEPTSAPTDVPATEPAATETPSPTPTETPTPEPPTSSPTVTATATAAATETATPDPSTTAPATATPSPTPTATPRSQVVLAEVKYTVTIRSVDLEDNYIRWTCYDVRRDAGGGTPGSLVVNVCDWQDDGIIEVQLPAGNYVLVETRRNNEVGTANNRAFTVSGNRTVTVKHQPLTTVVVTATDAVTGAVIADACFSLTAVTPVLIPIDVFACDFFDGTLDGVTTITGVDRATYTLGEHSGPFRYFTAADRQITVSTLSTPFKITVPHDRAASLIVHTEDATGAPLTGACFRLLENSNGVPGGQVWYSGCDGDFGVIDGDTELVAFASGTYFLNQTSTPAGYVPAPDQLVTVTVGGTAEVTVTDPTGGTVIINAFDDHDQPINDICPAVYRDAGGGTRGEQVPLPPCQTGDSLTDGVTRLIGLPPGNFLLVQFGAQSGYVRSADLPFSVVGSETQTLRVVNAIGGKIAITTVDSTDASHILPGSCFYVFLDAGGGAHGAQVTNGCDSADGLNDGVTTLVGFAAGTYVLMQGSAAASFNVAADRTFTIALGETQNITVADQPYGKVRILKQTPENAALPGACFIAIWGPGSQLPGYQVGNRVCDNQVGGNDGTTEIALPNGNFLLRETVAPAGYVFAADTPVTIATSGTVEVTIVDPTPSSITFTFVDVWGDPVPGFCIDLRGDSDTRGYLGIRTICDDGDGANDGIVYAPGLNTATYTIYGVSGPSQYVVPAVDPIALGVMETKTVEVKLTQAAPKITVGPFLGDVTQSSVTIYWETDQKTNGSVAYGLTDALGQTVTDNPTKQHRIKLTGLSLDRLYAFEVTATNPNGEDRSGLFSFRTLNGLQTSRIIVTTADSGGNAIAGACFDVFTNLGGGVPGAFVSGSCDRFDQSGADGKTIITGLVPGSYVLSEFYTPAPFKLAVPFAFTVDRAGQTVRKTVTNTRGGVVLRVIAGTNDPNVMGSCFSIYKDAGGGTFGDYVAGVCDEFDGEDGITTFSGLTAGNYVLWETYVPEGYIRAGIVQVQIARGLPEVTLWYEHWPKNATGNVLIKSIGPDGKLVPDACYALYSSDSRGTLYNFVADRCDGSDGRTDGLVYFTDVSPGTYTVVEYIAPTGFVAGKKTVVTKEPNKLLSKRVNQVAGGRAVIVTTLKGDTSTKLKGACYAIYRLAGNQWEPMTVACDDWDGTLDGITRVNGVPAGTYRLYQTSTPSGYKPPSYVTVTVGSTGNKSISVRTYPR